ncbi:MAG: ABC transporter permease [Rhizomicrobium sp.]
MSMRSDAMSDAQTAPGARAVAALSPTWPYFWSLRREIWEHRSVWIAPVAAAGFVLFGFAISLLRMPHTLREISKLPPAAQNALHMVPFGIAAAAVMLTTVIVAVFYCLGTLYNERRDRSILFWKSMPVSGTTTVLAKATIPMLVLPLVGFFVICATQLVMLGLDTIAFAANGLNPGAWIHLPLLRIWFLLFYGFVTLALWYAPIYGWLLVISAWAKRGPFLWAVLPVLAICVVEKLALDTSHFFDLVNYRLGGAFREAFVAMPRHLHTFQWPEPDPAKYFSSFGLWIGLVAAAAFLAAAIWLRRRREPV